MTQLFFEPNPSAEGCFVRFRSRSRVKHMVGILKNVLPEHTRFPAEERRLLVEGFSLSCFHPVHGEGTPSARLLLTPRLGRWVATSRVEGPRFLVAFLMVGGTWCIPPFLRAQFDCNSKKQKLPMSQESNSDVVRKQACPNTWADAAGKAWGPRKAKRTVFHSCRI